VSDWVVYSRDACSLCESFAQELAAVLGAASTRVRWVDITGDPELEARFRSKIPVLVIDDDIVCMYRVDAERVRAHLS
jgi:glutaredoxin